MKKMCLLLAVLLLMLAGCSYWGLPNTGSVPPAELTADQATAIALKHAGFTAEQVMGLRTEPDREPGGLHYDIEFYQGGYEYDYEIDAATGAVLSCEKDRND